MSAGRTTLVALAAAAGFVIGFYAGMAILLSIVGFDQVSGADFELATVPAGTLAAGLAASFGAPRTRRLLAPVLGVVALVAAVTTPLLIALDGDFGSAMAIGGGAAVLAATATTALIMVDRPG